ncbi:MAG TPA: hypothetical protein VMN56_20010 [Casimicrobiaceae bacterium]|nr:hypothetical protein [Casimicrobiaceae bacterium]
MEGYLRFAKAAAAERETHRVSEDEFMRMSREPETIVLDARSPQKYDELHIRGPYIALYTYGYRNIYELGPYVDIGGSSSSLRARIGRAAGTPAEIDREERTLRAEIAEELRGR